ncbi:MAG: chaperone modulator CbpM [Saprospiraceae bacterium]|nr:chaperone modulator CbpM [Saprospiraceae bacterium]
MSTENYVPVQQLCLHYNIEMSFINSLHEYGLIEINTIEASHFLHHDKISDLEKMIRLYHELDINLAGIDSVLHLLEKIDGLQTELSALRNRLRVYEGEEA